MPVRRFGQQKCEQIAQPVGAEHLRHPFGHDGQRRMMQILDIVTRHNVDFAVLIADQQLVILRANRTHPLLSNTTDARKSGLIVKLGSVTSRSKEA